MRGTNKIGVQFGAKFSPILSKLKDNATLKIAHDQAKVLFSEYHFKDILTPFISKMDIGDQSTEKQRKQLCKVYISFVDTFKQQILQEPYYEKLMESINRKQSGVSEVIGHICKSLLNRIQDQQILFPYISTILNVFLHNPEIAKVLKQLIETIEPNLIASLQTHIVSLLNEKVTAAKDKHDFLDAILTLVLTLEERIEVENQIRIFILKFMKNDDWNCRKTSVDICYALLLIRHERDDAAHSILKELKYDKIKHVREAVNNYETLYKQIFDQDLIPKQPATRDNRIKKAVSREDKVLRQKQVSPREKLQKLHSMDKTGNKTKIKNEKFFINAKNSNVIKTNEMNVSTSQFKEEKSDIRTDQNLSLNITSSNLTPTSQKQDFEAYLRNRNSPRLKVNNNDFKQFKEHGLDLTIPSSSKVQKGVKFNYKTQFQNFRKKNKVEEIERIKIQDQKLNSDIEDIELSRNQQFSLSCIQNKQGQQMQELTQIFLSFQSRINERLDRIQRRIDVLESTASPKVDFNFSNRSSISLQESSFPEGISQSIIHAESPVMSKSQAEDSCQAIESNLEEKVKLSIGHENWDEAFTIALTNNKRNILLNLLERCVFPRDKTVEECILLEIRKLFGYMSALKWLKYFLMEKSIDLTRLKRFHEDLQGRNSGDKNYAMMRQLLLNEIEQKMKSN